MPRIDTPIILVTRPAADAERFVVDLRAIALPFEAIISPAFEIEPIETDLLPFDVAIFTSRMGVVHAPLGQGRVAYCVGEVTATAAQGAGYSPISADGSAEDLVALILNRKQKGAMLHLRGEVSRGNVMNRLKDSGLDCRDVVVYRKAGKGPTTAIIDALGGTRNVIVPVFSAETVSILNDWPLFLGGSFVVAISDEVARAAAILKPASITVSDAPNMHSVTQAVARLIA